MTESHVLSVIVRTVVAFLVVTLAIDLWRARRSNGPIVAAFAWAFIGLVVPMYWYIVAALLWQGGVWAWLLPYFWSFAWLPWGVCLVTLIRLWRALHQERR